MNAGSANQRGVGRRPVYLVVALITLWLSAMNTLAEGYFTLEVVRDPLGTMVSTLGGQTVDDVIRAAFQRALAEHARVSVPIGIAQMMLGGLLVFVSVQALFGRRASTSFALQLIAANAALLIVAYLLREPVRASIVNTIVQSGIEPRPAGMSAAEFEHVLHERWWRWLRMSFGFQLGALLLSGFALTRRTARELLATPEPRTTDQF